jgi:hypothetical protein
MSKTLFMETTEIRPEKTAGELTGLLVSAGARQIATDYNGNGRITGLRWTMKVGPADVLFAMPVRIEPIFKLLKDRRGSTWLSDQDKVDIREKAERVAWRQLYRWTQAQVAMIETGMVEAAEVFLPYADIAGESLYSRMVASGMNMRMLTAGPEAR